jgi:hypothetical protein
VFIEHCLLLNGSHQTTRGCFTVAGEGGGEGITVFLYSENLEYSEKTWVFELNSNWETVINTTKVYYYS